MSSYDLSSDQTIVKLVLAMIMLPYFTLHLKD